MTNLDRDDLIARDEDEKLNNFTKWHLKTLELEKKEDCMTRSRDLNRGIR